MNANRKQCLTVPLALLFFPLVSCDRFSRLRENDLDRTQIDCTLMLSSEELASMKEAAVAGDGRASYLVYQHYSFGLNDPSRGQPWLEKSAAADFPFAIEALQTLDEIKRDRERSK